MFDISEAVVRECSVKKVFLEISRRKPLYRSLFFNKGIGWKPATLLKTRFRYRCFTVNFVNFFKNVFLTEHPLTFISDISVVIIIFHMRQQLSRFLSSFLIKLSNERNFIKRAPKAFDTIFPVYV